MPNDSVLANGGGNHRTSGESARRIRCCRCPVRAEQAEAMEKHMTTAWTVRAGTRNGHAAEHFEAHGPGGIELESCTVSGHVSLSVSCNQPPSFECELGLTFGSAHVPTDFIEAQITSTSNQTGAHISCSRKWSRCSEVRNTGRWEHRQQWELVNA